MVRCSHRHILARDPVRLSRSPPPARQSSRTHLATTLPLCTFLLSSLRRRGIRRLSAQRSSSSQPLPDLDIGCDPVDRITTLASSVSAPGCGDEAFRWIASSGTRTRGMFVYAVRRHTATGSARKLYPQTVRVTSIPLSFRSQPSPVVTVHHGPSPVYVSSLASPDDCIRCPPASPFLSPLGTPP